MAWPYYIDAAASPGGTGTSGDPYDTWAAFITGQATDLTSPANGESIVYVKGTMTNGGNAGGYQYTSAGFTQDASNYLHVKLWPGEENFSAIIIGSTSGGGTTYWTPGAYTRVTGIVFKSGSTGNNRVAQIPQFGYAYDCKYIQEDGAAADVVRTSADATMVNCYVESNDAGTGLYNGIYASSASTTSTIDFCTVIRKGGTTGAAFEGRSSNAVYRNCVAYGTWTTEWATDPSASSGYNAGEIASGSQPTEIQDNYVLLSSDPFDDSGAGDYHPAASGALDGAGVAVGGITTDAEGTSRASPPSIGFLEVASGASVADVNFHGTNRGILRGVNRGIG